MCRGSGVLAGELLAPVPMAERVQHLPREKVI
jgi:hypothetical protein